MRLRLQIERDDGLISKILWGLENGHKAENITIAELLEEIDKAVGIYLHDRDFNSFSVAVDGYECLEHLAVGKLLRDGDVVTIKPRVIEYREPIKQVPEPPNRRLRRISFSQTTELSSLGDYADDAPPRPSGENGEPITDLIVLNPRQRSPSLARESKSDNSPSETASERSWSSIDSRDVLSRTLRSCPRGEIAMNYHHDHLLHQKWPSEKRPPPRTGKCTVCPRKRRHRAPKMQMVEAFSEECFYCKIILEVVRLHGTTFSAHTHLLWWGGSWYDFDMRCNVHPPSRIRGKDRDFAICSADLFVLSDGGNHYNDLPVWNATATDTGSEEAFLKALGWIQDCLVFHDRCDKNNRVSLPHRVLDLEAADSEDRLRLYEGNGDIGRYVSLSHCWGDSDYPAKTTSHTLDQNRKSILWGTLPKTFQDAIVFTRWLGIRYLWIDSLCIIQDSREDWLEESVKMVHIYQNSYVTLAATASPSDDGGLFYTKEPEELPIRLFGLASDGIPYNIYLRSQISHVSTGEYSSHTDPKDVPLLSRAWAYQEILLSPRVLHFGKQELRWECMERTYCECGKDDDLTATNRHYEPHKFRHSSTLASWRNKPALHSRWRAIVHEYSGLALTFGKDKLPGLSGLAKQMQRYRPADKYIGGLWIQSLFQDMLWSVTGLGSKQEENENQDAPMSVSRLSDNWRAPTWSWASSNKSVVYHFGGRVRRTYVKLMNLAVESASIGDETGALLRAEMVLNGKLIPATWYDRLTPSYRLISVHLRLASTGIIAWQINLDNFQHPETYLPGYDYGRLSFKDFKKAYRDRPSYTVTGMDNQVMCLPLLEVESDFLEFSTDCYLLMNKVRTEDNGQEVYRRLGMMTINRKRGEQFPFEDWPTTRFTFI